MKKIAKRKKKKPLEFEYKPSSWVADLKSYAFKEEDQYISCSLIFKDTFHKGKK